MIQAVAANADVGLDRFELVVLPHRTGPDRTGPDRPARRVVSG